MQLSKTAKLLFLTLAVSARASQILVNNYCLVQHWITEINGTWNSNGTWALDSGVAYITPIVGKSNSLGITTKNTYWVEGRSVTGRMCWTLYSLPISGTPKLILGYSSVDGELWWSVSSYDGEPYPPKHFNITSPSGDSEDACGEAVGYEAKNHNCKDSNSSEKQSATAQAVSILRLSADPSMQVPADLIHLSRLHAPEHKHYLQFTTMCRRTYTDDFDLPYLSGTQAADPPNLLHPTSATWHEATRTKKTADIREALGFQNQVEEASHKLSSICSSDVAGHTEEVAECAARIASASAGLSRFWAKMVGTHLFNERRASAGAARRVFDVPELLERILTFLGRRELLIVQRVNKTMFAAIENSVILARKLHLLPNASGHLETPFSKTRKYRYRTCPGSCRRKWTSPFHLPGFKCYSMSRVPHVAADPGALNEVSDPENYRCRTIAAAVRPRKEGAAPIGARCRKMLICNPPVTEMQVYPHCCAYMHYEHDYVFGSQGFPPPVALPPPPPPPIQVLPPLPPPPPPLNAFTQTFPQPFQLPQPIPHPRPNIKPVTNKNGITVGDLLDKASELALAHKLCPFASAGHHDQDGNVKVSVQFATTVKLKEDDPAVKPTTLAPTFPLDDVDLSASMSPSDPASHSARLNRYISAKRAASDEGRPIPTFDEFKASEEDEHQGMSTDQFAALISSQQQNQDN
ncbi:hypothetical protein AC579_3668 [Pseudocercospora musae]|uniref:F-box domain-containing protein n=1 Tax=Pseudocercospora musae TaxID=113226 RepID=A0A139IIP8_9PEZI|nr:hypothetical protein AC579_3668 [Pseudocercospora musae]